ncbi:MAG: GTPase Era, partial [Thioalkalispiraceae bacterium]
TDSSQIIYVDTPGIHQKAGKAINRYMNRAATSTLDDVHAIVFIIEALKWTDEDEMVLKRIKQSTVPVVLAVNKVDRLENKEDLLPFLQQMAEKHDFKDIIPISALKNTNVTELESLLESFLDISEPFYPEDQITDRSSRFLAAEIVREKLMRTLGQELPYNITVEIEQFKEQGERLVINALIWVERENQKAIVIGKKGQQLKKVGSQAREDMQRLFERRVHLELWVKVKEGWSDDERALQSLGYTDEL